MLEDKIIDLDDRLFIAAGAFCRCYAHPTDHQKCIKIPTSNKKAKKRHQADLKYYAKLHSQQVELKCIADYLGKSDTSLGKGYIYQCIRDHNGEISKTLESYLKSPDTQREKIYSQLHKLALYLVENKIIISDLHARNILMQKQSDGNMTPIIVDGIGDRVAITILNNIPKLAISKITRRWNRFAIKELDSHSMLT